MAYDPVKAHEYYMKYRKKGLKKGRKRGRKKATTKKETLVGLTTAGLNDNGKMLWAMKKKELQAEMNTKLAGVTDPAERQGIINDYQNTAMRELQRIKSNPSNAQAKAKKESSGKSASSNASKSSSGGSKSSKDSNNVKEKSSESKSKVSRVSTPKANITLGGGKTGGGGKMSTADQNRITNQISNSDKQKEQAKAEKQAQLDQVRSQIDDIHAQFANMSPEQQKEVREILSAQVKALKEKAKQLRGR